MGGDKEAEVGVSLIYHDRRIRAGGMESRCGGGVKKNRAGGEILIPEQETVGTTGAFGSSSSSRLRDLVVRGPGPVDGTKFLAHRQKAGGAAT